VPDVERKEVPAVFAYGDPHRDDQAGNRKEQELIGKIHEECGDAISEDRKSDAKGAMLRIRRTVPDRLAYSSPTHSPMKALPRSAKVITTGRISMVMYRGLLAHSKSEKSRWLGRSRLDRQSGG